MTTGCCCGTPNCQSCQCEVSAFQAGCRVRAARHADPEARE